MKSPQKTHQLHFMLPMGTSQSDHDKDLVNKENEKRKRDENIERDRVRRILIEELDKSGILKAKQ
jgi:hypothetical protein